MRISKLVAQDKYIFLFEQGIFSALTFISSFAIAKNIGIKEFGYYAGILLFVYMILSVSNAIVIQPMQVAYHRFSAEKEYASYNFVMLTGICTGISLIVVLSSQWISQMTGVSVPAIIAGTALMTAFILFDFFRRWFLTSGQLTKAISISALLLVSHLVFFVLLYLYECEVQEIVMMMVAVYLIPTMIGIFFLKPKFMSKVVFYTYFSDSLHQSKWLLPTAMIQWWSGNFFVVSAGIFISPAALGVFRLVQSGFGVINMILQAYENYLTPKAAKIFDNKSKSEAASLIKNISIKFLGGIAIILLIIILGADTLIHFIQINDLITYSFVVKGMAILYIFILLNYPVRIFIRTAGQNHLFFEGYLLSLAFSLTSFKFLLQTWGISGAIAGLIFSQLLMMAFWQYKLSKLNNQL